jgi:hypothetical protein
MMTQPYTAPPPSSSINPICFLTAIKRNVVVNMTKPRRLRERLHLQLFVPPNILTPIIRVDSLLTFLSHLTTAECPPFSTIQPKTDLIRVHIQCNACHISIFTVIFTKACTNFTMYISYLCPHQKWTRFASCGKKDIYLSNTGFAFSSFHTSHPLRCFGKYLDKQNSTSHTFVMH